MARIKTTSNTFVVTTVEDGVSVPSYIQSQEAWSNQTTTASQSTMPSDCSENDWMDYTPPQNGKTYLWRRSRTMTLNNVTMTYTPSAWVYSRLSGTNGTSITIKGSIQTAIGKNDHLPQTATEGDTIAWMGADGIDYYYKYHNGAWEEVLVGNSEFYTIEKDSIVDGVNMKGHLVGYNYEADKWLDYGMFQGKNGLTYYTHVAWAEDVTIGDDEDSGQEVPDKPTGQTTEPNASIVSGFSIAPGEGKGWMGVMIDQTVTDSQTGTLYTWSYTKGNPSETYFIEMNRDYVVVPANGDIVFSLTGRFMKHVAGDSPFPIAGKWGILVYRWKNGNKSKSGQVQVGVQGLTIPQVQVDKQIEAIEVYMLEEQLESGFPTTWLAKAEIAIIPEGEKGEDGNDGTDGDNAMRLDLDNEMDAIQYNSVTGAQLTNSVITRARLYDGHNLVNATNVTWSLSVSKTGNANDCTANLGTISDGAQPVTVTAMNTSANIGKAEVTITATYQSKSYSAVFTVNKLVGESKYVLEVTPSAISYNSTTDATTTPVTIQIKRRRQNENSFTTLTSLSEQEGGSTTNLILSVKGYTGEVTGGGAAMQVTYNSTARGWIFTSQNATYRNYVVELSNSTTILDRETIPVAKVANGAKGNDGENVVRADLTNEMDAVAISSEGRVLVATTLTTGVKMFDGTNPMSLSGITWNNSSIPSGFTVSLVPSSGTPTGISVTASNGSVFPSGSNDKLVIPLTATCVIGGSNVSRVVDFTIQGVRSGKDGVVYQLRPSDTTIKKTQSGNKVPTNISCAVMRRVGNEQPTAVSDSTVKVFYQIDSNGAWQAYTVGNNIGTSTVTDFIRFRLYQGNAVISNGNITGGVLIDVETVPLLEAGVDGSSPLVIDLSNQMDSIPMTMEGGVIGDGTSQNKAHASTTISLYYGATKQTITGMSTSYTHTGVNVDFPKVSGSDDYTGAMNVTIDDGTTFANDKAVITVQATCTNGSRTIDFVIQGVRAGGIGLSPTIYSLGVSHDEIKVNSSGTRLPQTMKVYRKSTTGDTTEPTTNGAVFYSVDGGNEVQFLWGTGTEATINQTILNSVTNNITFRYYDTNAKTTLLDTETVPVVYDGESPYWIDIQESTAYVDQKGTPHISLSWYVKQGDAIVPHTDSNSCSVKLSNDVFRDAGVHDNLYDDDGIESNYNNDASIIITYEEGSGSSAVVKASTSIPITRYGSDATTYKIETQKQNIIIPSDQTQVQYVDQASFFKVEGETQSAYASGYGAFYKRVGSTYTRIMPTASQDSWSAGATMSINSASQIMIDNTVDEVLVYLASSYSNLPKNARPTTYLAVKGIPVTKKGDTGNPSTTYEIVIASEEAYMDSTGKLHGNVYWDVYEVQGTQRTKIDVPAPSGMLHQFKLNTEGSWGSCQNASSGHAWTCTLVGGSYVSYYDGKKWEDDLRLQEMPTSVEIRFLKYDSVQGALLPVATKSVPISIRGQMGRNFYYDGEWSASKTYTITDHSAPYVSLTEGGSVTYWVMIGDNRSISGNNHKPSNDTDDWEMMTTTFKYLISEAIFTNFAKLGASVFNGDYMFSQHGYATGFDGARQKIEDGSMFQYVDPENMEGTVVETWQGAIWSDNTERTIDEGGWEKVLGATNFPEGYYTIKIHGHGASEGETLKWMITSSPNIAPWASGEIENGSQVAIFRAEDDSLSLYVSDSTDGDGAVYEACTVKQCGFTPTYYLNLRTGQLVANDVTARGAIYADEGVFRGTVYAENGEFNGRVVATSGEFRNITTPNGAFNIDENGYLECSDAKVKGSIYNPLFVINDNNMLMYVLPHWSSSSVIDYYNILLDLTGLNVMIDWNWPTGAYIQLPCTDSKYNGAKAHIYNGTSQNVSIHGALTNIANYYSLTTGQIGIFYCVPNGVNFVWIKIN